MKKIQKPKSQTASEIRLESSLSRIKISSRRYGKVDFLTAQTYLSFIYTYDQVSSYLNAITRIHGITQAGINVLTILRSNQEKGCNQQKLSQLLLVSRANITGLVDGLIRKGFAQRMPDESDRRACIVKISQAGEELLDEILPQYHCQIAKIFSELNDKEKNIFNKILEKIRVTMDTMEKKSDAK